MALVLSNISNILIPVIIFYVIAYGISQGVQVYEVFIKGALEGLKTVMKIMPTLIGLMVAVGILRVSGLMEFLATELGVLFQNSRFPVELVPLTLVRLFSSSAAVGLAVDIFKTYGTDSYIGKVASIMMSCTETVFYTMSVYFMAAKVKKTRWTLPGALLATLAGIIASVFLAKWM